VNSYPYCHPDSPDCTALQGNGLSTNRTYLDISFIFRQLPLTEIIMKKQEVTPNEIKIRSGIEKDLAAILDIYNDAILKTTAVYDYQPHTLEMRRKWFEEKQEKNIPVLVAELNDRVVGFVSYGSFRSWAAYKYSIEHSVYVHPDHRRKGIAKKLMGALIDIVKRKEVHTIIAGINADNSGSIHLHKQLGFEEVGNFKQVGYKFGTWLDLKFFQLILSDHFQPVEINNEHY
jgi:L-amino acid N-acyltransferase YncA